MYIFDFLFLNFSVHHFAQLSCCLSKRFINNFDLTSATKNSSTNYSYSSHNLYQYFCCNETYIFFPASSVPLRLEMLHKQESFAASGEVDTVA